MPSLISLLSGTSQATYRGVIEEKKGSLYLVSIGSKSVLAKSAVTNTLAVGTSVVVTKTPDAYFVIGEETRRSTNTIKVYIEG